MHDSTIIPDHYAYSLRYDLPKDYHVSPPQAYLIIFKRIISSLSFITHYLGMCELGEKTLKPHIQAIIWSPKKLTVKQMQTVRNRVRSNNIHLKDSMNKGQLSFASARKEKSLAGYVTKTAEGKWIGISGPVFTNLTPEQCERIPKWQSIQQYRRDKKSLLERTLDKNADKWSATTDYPSFCEEFNDIYYKIYDRHCIRRNTYFHYALKYHVITPTQFLEKIGAIKIQNYSPYS